MPKPPLPEEAVAFLTRPNYATISVVRPDGQPVSVPTWYLFEDGRLVVNMDAGHAGSSGRYDAIREVAHDWAFVLAQLGIAR